MSEDKKEKPATRRSRKQVLLILAQKIKIIDEQFKQMRILVDELEDRVADLEERIYDERDVHFRSDFDWDD
jgi:hypothetical protein